MRCFIGIDLGSTTTKAVVIDELHTMLESERGVQQRKQFRPALKVGRGPNHLGRFGPCSGGGLARHVRCPSTRLALAVMARPYVRWAGSSRWACHRGCTAEMHSRVEQDQFAGDGAGAHQPAGMVQGADADVDRISSGGGVYCVL